MKHFFNSTEFQLDEILFESRNRSYGAYTLRRDSDRILTKSFLYAVAFFAVAAAVPFLMKSSKITEVVTPGTGPEIRLRNVDRPDVTSIPPRVVQPPKAVKTFDSTVPTPVSVPRKEKPAAAIAKYDGAVAGTQDTDGVKPNVSVVPTPPATGPAAAPPATVAPAVTPNIDAVISNVDVEASFFGGINAFRSKVQSNFDSSQFEGQEGIMKTTVTFIVERDGSISNVKATGPDAGFNREAERTVKSIKGKWQPAKFQGQIVRSSFRFPISMQFE